ncbi:hypothetical protein KKH23_09015, partial [Patescibacteria group bacterium]|nr:hypothetical protein [Patescibacteria group bacterium]
GFQEIIWPDVKNVSAYINVGSKCPYIEIHTEGDEVKIGPMCTMIRETSETTITFFKDLEFRHPQGEL